MTRQEYLNARGDRTKAFREYYSQFVDDAIRATVLRTIGKAQITESTDPHFNDIPLRWWDAITLPPGNINARMKELGDYLTLAGKVCILKEAAQQIRESNKPYMDNPGFENGDVSRII